MKKGQEISGIVEEVDFPNVGRVIVNDEDGRHEIKVKNVLPGSEVLVRISKKRKGKFEGRLLKVLQKSPLEKEVPCKYHQECGGCLYQGISYEDQLALKEKQIRRLLAPEVGEELYDKICEGIIKSPEHEFYRNKMELSFGDNEKGGELMLGLHRRGSFYDIIPTTGCRIQDKDMSVVQQITLDFFRRANAGYFHKRTHEGYLRHLLLRKGRSTGELLISLVTTTQFETMEGCIYSSEDEMLRCWSDALLAGYYDGRIVGILHTRNDRVADIVCDEGTDVLFGKDYFFEELLGLRFKVTPFSFFQTNTFGAERLYDAVRDFISSQSEGQRVFDLYSGTGTIAQIVSESARTVTGVEIVKEAVEAAKENAALNDIENADFIAGDVLKVLDELEEKPDIIILDPPRDGIHPRALPKIISFCVENILYISCKPTSLKRDLPVLSDAGYKPVRIVLVDMFPFTANVETVCLLSNRKPDARVKIDVDLEDYYRIKDEQKKNQASE